LRRWFRLGTGNLWLSHRITTIAPRKVHWRVCLFNGRAVAALRAIWAETEQAGHRAGTTQRSLSRHRPEI